MVIEKHIEKILVDTLGADLIDVAYKEGFESGKSFGFYNINPYKNFENVQAVWGACRVMSLPEVVFDSTEHSHREIFPCSSIGRASGCGERFGLI